MKQRSIYLFVWGLWTLTLCTTGCSDTLSDTLLPEEGNDRMRVTLTVAGEYGAPFSDLQSPQTRSGEDYGRDLEAYIPYQIPDSTTLWVSIEHQPADGEEQEPAILKSYVVKNETLYPCTVDKDGTLLYESTDPLYLNKGKTYHIRAMGPARQLTDDNRLYVQNGEYVFANDNRYAQTQGTEVTIRPENQADGVYTIRLNPLIQQTAQLKFTLVAATDDSGYSPIHSLEVMPIGIEISGLQEHYCRHTDDNGQFIPASDEAEPWNWQWGTTYLRTYPGKVYNYLILHEPLRSTNREIVFQTAILPTDAVANPIIVMFNLRVNGVPTQFEMMLNRKMFLHAYSYHYKGTINIQEGIACMEWQSVVYERHKDLPVITTKK